MNLKDHCFGQGARLFPLLQTPRLNLLPPVMPDKVEGKVTALQAKAIFMMANLLINSYVKEILFRDFVVVKFLKYFASKIKSIYEI